MRTLLILFIGFSLAFSQPKEPPKGERCVICGMDVNIDPRLTSQAKLRDGSYRYAESPKHIVQFYLDNKDKVSELWVRDYQSGKGIDARRAFYVPIKDGPMGPDLAAFRSNLEAQRFAKTERAAKEKVYRFMDINKELLQRLEKGQIH
ncbi:MAG: hypothetical protein D6674_04390 [Acidobacteria bacterium]|jgi:nitrous oxide reductase accessory protein NosL|nr:MAG: hypothetical protein D6674_04390 [Acidobacteriota bacterium]